MDIPLQFLLLLKTSCFFLIMFSNIYQRRRIYGANKLRPREIIFKRRYIFKTLLISYGIPYIVWQIEWKLIFIKTLRLSCITNYIALIIPEHRKTLLFDISLRLCTIILYQDFYSCSVYVSKLCRNCTENKHFQLYF